MKKILLFIATILTIATGVSVSAAVQTTKSAIDATYIWHDWLHVHLTESQTNTENCVSTHYYAIHKDDDNYASKVSMILAAQMSGKSIQFWVNGCGGQSSEYVRVENIWVLSE